MPVSGIDRLHEVSGAGTAGSIRARPALPTNLPDTIGAFADPARNHRFAVLAVAATVVVYAFVPTLGPVAGLVAAALWLPLVPFRRDLVHPTRIEALVWLVPLFALASALWSNAPETTAFAAVELAVTVACAHVAARAVTVDSLLKGVLGGATLVAGLAVAGGHFPLVPGQAILLPTLVSPAGDFVFALGVLAGLSLLLPLRLSGRRAIAVGLATVVSALDFAADASLVTSLALAAATLVVVALTVTREFKPRVRWVLVPVLAAGVAASAALAHFAVVDPARHAALWAVARKAAGGRPLLGYGYQGFWIDAHAPAERMRALFGNAAMQDLSFHNLWVEALVQGGVVGLAIIALVFLAGGVTTLRRLFAGRVSRRAVALAGLLAFFVVRSAFEVDHFQPNAVGTFVFVASLILIPALGPAVPSRPLLKRPRARPVRSKSAPPPPLPRPEKGRVSAERSAQSVTGPSQRRRRTPSKARRADSARPDFRLK